MPHLCSEREPFELIVQVGCRMRQVVLYLWLSIAGLERPCSCGSVRSGFWGHNRHSRNLTRASFLSASLLCGGQLPGWNKMRIVWPILDFDFDLDARR